MDRATAKFLAPSPHQRRRSRTRAPDCAGRDCLAGTRSRAALGGCPGSAPVAPKRGFLSPAGARLRQKRRRASRGSRVALSDCDRAPSSRTWSSNCPPRQTKETQPRTVRCYDDHLRTPPAPVTKRNTPRAKASPVLFARRAAPLFSPLKLGVGFGKSRFRTIQVYPKSAARKHAQALALSKPHISRHWRQKAFPGSVENGKACRA